MWHVHANFFHTCITELLSLWIFFSDLAIQNQGHSFSFTTSTGQWLRVTHWVLKPGWTISKMNECYHETILLIYNDRSLCLAVKAFLGFVQTYSSPSASSTLLQSHCTFFSFPEHTPCFATFALGQLSTSIAFSPSALHVLYSLPNHQVQLKPCVCHKACPDPPPQAERHLLSSDPLTLFSKYRNCLFKDVHSSMVIKAKKWKGI